MNMQDMNIRELNICLGKIDKNYTKVQNIEKHTIDAVGVHELVAVLLGARDVRLRGARKELSVQISLT